MKLPTRQEAVRFLVRLTPHGGADAIEGWIEGSDGKRFLKARVAAVPEAGKANAALIALLAKNLGVAKSAIRIVRGETARMKIVAVEGEGASLAAKIEALGAIG